MQKSALIRGSLLAVTCAFFSAQAQAVILWDNGPPSNLLSDAIGAAAPFWVADAFQLSANAQLTGVSNLGLWDVTGSGAPTTLDWSILTSPTSTSVIAQGQASLTSTFLSNYQGSYDTYSASFALPGVSLSAGTYYLRLANAHTPGSDQRVWWNRSSADPTGPQAYSSLFASYIPYNEAFQIVGTYSVVPEVGLARLLGDL